jgi:predicted metal-dependent phosphoesterase TrpH
VPDFITLAGAIEELERQGAAVLVPHPGFLTVSLDRADVAVHRDVIDAVEVYDPKLRARDVDGARALARETGLPAFGSSYAHLRGSVGEVWTAFDRPIPGEAALVAAFREGADRRVFRRSGRAHRRRCRAEVSHLANENTVKKLDRVLGSGIEATHPRHPAYGGRFDDVACY